MDVVVVFNGLGNQMSQYAFYLAKKHINPSVKVIFDPRSVNEHNGLELNRLFGIELNRCLSDRMLANLYFLYRKRVVHRIIDLFSIGIVSEPHNYDFTSKLRDAGGKYLLNYYFGGWHSEKYFKDIEDEIRATFRFPEVTDSPKFVEWKHRICCDNQSVSLHIRRGDFLYAARANGVKPHDGVCTVAYYQKAIEYIKQQVITPNFYVFSDDIDWCKITFGTECMNYIDCNSGRDSWRDMYLMTMCRHHINANSSFSWWGAWLSQQNGIVICPSRFVSDIVTKDIYPESWIKIE
jgi:hypothetical protein